MPIPRDKVVGSYANPDCGCHKWHTKDCGKGGICVWQTCFGIPTAEGPVWTCGDCYCGLYPAALPFQAVEDGIRPWGAGKVWKKVETSAKESGAGAPEDRQMER